MADLDAKLRKVLERTTKELEAKNINARMYAGDDISISSHIPYTLPTGLAELDLQLGGKGGLPAGRLIEYFGFEMCGKTTACLHTIAEIQKRGGHALFVDTEHTFSPQRAKQCGVNLDRLQVISAHSIEAAFESIYRFIEECEELGITNEIPVLIVVDSITGTHTEAEFNNKEKKDEWKKDQRLGAEAKAIRRGVKKLNGMLARTKAICILINHAIATNLTATFGKKSDSAGGHGAKIMSSIRVCFRHKGKLKDKNTRLREGQQICLSIEKLKNAHLTMDEVAEIHIGKVGFDQERSLLEAGLKTGWITVSGPKNSLTYSLDYAGVTKEFKRRGWLNLIEELGGYDTVYDLWVERAKESGHMLKWEDSW
jgi:recombination protein RecA